MKTLLFVLTFAALLPLAACNGSTTTDDLGGQDASIHDAAHSG